MNEEDGGEQGIEREGQRVQREGRGIHRGGRGILSPRVTVFGAGVAGLTAAHELVERGFAVKVVEPTESLDIDGDCEVGGLARSQYSHVSVPEPASGQGGTSPYPKMRTAWPVIRVPQHIHFSTPVGGQSQIYDPGYVLKPGAPHGGIVHVYSIPNSVKLGEVARALFLGAVAYIKLGKVDGRRCKTCSGCKICEDYRRCQRCRECVKEDLCKGWNLEVEVVGHSDSDPGVSEARKIGLARAEAVFKALQPEINACEKGTGLSPAVLIDLIPKSMGCYPPLVDESEEFGRKLNNRVEFHVCEIRLPGEHGYRFFPRFYRHLDNVMGRTPLYRDGEETARCALDNLNSLEETALAFADAKPQVAVLRRRPASLEEARLKFEEYQRALGTTPRDMALAMAKFVRYLTTCSDRREAECENQSWWSYMDGPKFSESMQRYLKATPQAMVAMSVMKSDARTNGNSTVQLLLDQLSDGKNVDRTLNGPTSEAWLRHWKDYLRRQGVVFYVGCLARIDAVQKGGETRLEPTVHGIRNGEENEGGAVRAVDEPGLEIESRDAPDLEDFRNDDFYVLALPPEAGKEVLASVADHDLNDTLRTLKHYDFSNAMGSMVGIQFYFRNNFKFFPGHTFFVDSAWRLTSISQLQFWRRKRTVESGYLGVLSVDIGDMFKRDTSQTRILAFESEWSAKRARGRAVNNAQKKKARRARKAAKAAMAMRLHLPVAASPEQVDVLRKIWALPWLRDLLSLADAAPRKPVKVKALVTQPTDVVLDGIQQMSEHVPELIGRALRTGAKAMLSVPLSQRGLPDQHVARAGALAIAAATLAVGGRTAWKSTRQEIANTTWRQVKLGLDYEVARTLPEPIFYWIDETVEFGEDDKPLRNKSKLMTQRPGEFAGRPGPLPTRPGQRDSTYYEVCRKQWVLTGLVTKTHTRLTTMELCAESGKHATNAILDAIQDPEKTVNTAWVGKRIADYCQIWNIEDYEVEDLAPMKRIDARLLAEGLPHFMDIIGADQLIEHYVGGGKAALPAQQLWAFYDAARGTVQEDWPYYGSGAASAARQTLARIYGPEAARILGGLFEKWLRRFLSGAPGTDPIGSFLKLLYPRHDDSASDALRDLLRGWADFVEKYMLERGGK